jgi:hypothetical protein
MIARRLSPILDAKGINGKTRLAACWKRTMCDPAAFVSWYNLLKFQWNL